MQQTYVVQTRELEGILHNRGWMWTNSYHAGDHNWSRPPSSKSYTFAEAVRKEKLPVEVRPYVRD